uniref:Putative snare protein syntaxin 1 n=1 Tax=Tabanus bromius TaxID=304241 RepID=A0A0K8TNM0_TABBR
MTKDRLQELRKISGVAYTSNWNVATVNIDNEHPSVDDILGQYVEIRKNLQNIAANLNEMKKLVQTADLRQSTGNDMEKLRNQNLSIGTMLINRFKELKADLPKSDDYTLEARMKRTLFYGMHQEYINIWTSHEEFLQNYETKLKKNLQLHSKIMNYQHTEEEVEELIRNKQTSLFVDNILEETERERRTLRDLLQRYSELEKLERSLSEVHALFLRIQNLVMEQSERIQVVEYHAQQASVRVDRGTENLEKARSLKQKALKCKTCLIISVIVVLFILIFFIFSF